MPFPPKYNERSVGSGEMVISRDPRDVLVIHGLGSCVGVAFTDCGVGVAGLAHVFLPDSRTLTARQNRRPWNCADQAIPELLHQVLRHGARRSQLRVVLAGGATLGAVTSGTSVGRANVDACQSMVRDLGLPLDHALLGGSTWRTMKVIVTTGETAVITEHRQDSVELSKRPGLASSSQVRRRLESVQDVLECLSPLVGDGEGERPSTTRNYRPRNADEIAELLQHLIHTPVDATRPPATDTETLRAMIDTDIAKVLEPLLLELRRHEGKA